MDAITQQLHWSSWYADLLLGTKKQLLIKTTLTVLMCFTRCWWHLWHQSVRLSEFHHYSIMIKSKTCVCILNLALQTKSLIHTTNDCYWYSMKLLFYFIKTTLTVMMGFTWCWWHLHHQSIRTGNTIENVCVCILNLESKNSLIYTTNFFFSRWSLSAWHEV